MSRKKNEHAIENQHQPLDDCPMDKVRRVNNLEKAMDRVMSILAEIEKTLAEHANHIAREGNKKKKERPIDF